RSAPPRGALLLARADLLAVELADVDAVLEVPPVAEPLEAVHQHDLALGADRDVGKVSDRLDLRADLERDLTGQRVGELVRRPAGHDDDATSSSSPSSALLRLAPARCLRQSVLRAPRGPPRRPPPALLQPRLLRD